MHLKNICAHLFGLPTMNFPFGFPPHSHDHSPPPSLKTVPLYGCRGLTKRSTRSFRGATGNFEGEGSDGNFKAPLEAILIISIEVDLRGYGK